MQDWDIKSRTDLCGVCQKFFEDQEVFFSRLYFGTEGYMRYEYCPRCWDLVEDKDVGSFWKSIFIVPPPPENKEPVQKETAESLLRRLVETDDTTIRNTIYILAVMLERKRILQEQHVETRADGIKIRVYEHKKTNETFLIPDPVLQLRQLEMVQEEVVAMLSGGKEEVTQGAASVGQ